MSEHTSIPWEVDPRANLRVRIKTGDRTVSSSIYDGYAPQIVAEHNSHDALVEALKEADKLADMCTSTFSAGGMWPELRAQGKVVQDKICAALKSAGEPL
jgi:hypothetical protein